jgi:hypothetical protein
MMQSAEINWISAASNGADLKARIFAGRELFAFFMTIRALL